MRQLVAVLVACALLGSCAMARRHPRIATMTMVSLTAAVLTTVTVNGSCTSQPGDECSLAHDAPLIAVTTIGGAVAGYFLYDAAAEPPPTAEAWSPVPPLPRGASIASPAKVTPVDAPPLPATWSIPLQLTTAPLGVGSFRRAGHASSSGLMAACANAKRDAFAKLDIDCKRSTRHVGVATHTAAESPCACQLTTTGYDCMASGEATCTPHADDLSVLGTGWSATRSVAEARAISEAEHRCWASGAPATLPPTVTCECDATLGAASQTCGCIATADCGP